MYLMRHTDMQRSPALREAIYRGTRSGVNTQVTSTPSESSVSFSPVSRATRTGLSSGADERPPLQEMDHYRQDDRRRCRWQLLPTHTRTAECLAVRLQVRWRAIDEDASEDFRCCLASRSVQKSA